MSKITLSQVINQSHHGARKLLGGLRSAQNLREKQRSVQEFTKDYALRRTVEDDYIIPEFLKLDHINYKNVHQMKKNNMQFDELFAKLEKLSLNTNRLAAEQQTFNQALDEVLNLTESHLHLQETEILPHLENNLPASRLEELGNDTDYVIKYNQYGLKGHIDFLGNEYLREFNHDHAISKEERERQDFEAAENEKIKALEHEIRALEKQ